MVSIVLDGATIVDESSWYSLGIATECETFFYDVYHFVNSRSQVITSQVFKIITELESKCECCVIGASSDNAKNMINVFDNDHKDGLAVMYKKFMLHSPCQAHTSNPVITTLRKDNPYINQIMGCIQAIAEKFHSQKTHILCDIPVRCPLIREQRWHTHYAALHWFIQNHEAIQKGY